MQLTRYKKNREGLIEIKGKNEYVSCFIAVYKSMDAAEYSKQQRERYINAIEIKATMQSSFRGAASDYPSLKADLARTTYYDVSSLKEGDFIEIAYPHQNKDRFFGLVIENGEKSLLLAGFKGFKAMANFQQKNKENALTAIKNHRSGVVSPKHLLIAARFAELEASPADYVSRFDEVRADIKNCQLCDTRISKAFLIEHIRDHSKNRWVGSECVHKQALASGSEAEVVKAEILMAWARGIKNKGGQIEGAEIHEIEAPAPLCRQTDAEIEEEIEHFYRGYEVFKKWKKDKIAAISEPLNEKLIEQLKKCNKTEDFAEAFLAWYAAKNSVTAA